MIKQEYIIQSIKNNKHLQRGWLLSIFGILPPNAINLEVGYKLDGDMLYMALDNSDWVEIDDYIIGQPLVGRNELLDLPKDILPNITEGIKTSYGILIINSIVLLYPYGGLVPYINGEITPKALNNIAYNMLKTNGTIEMHIRFENAVMAITALSQAGVPSASRKSITPNPLIPIRKAELLKEHADNLNDPTVVAGIQKELVKMDREYLKGDSSMGFFIKGKSMNMTRLRTMSMYGAEPDFYDESKISVINNSLTEGWTVEDLPILINSARGGSYSRSASTALGGDEVKVTTRVFQNYTLSDNDCHTKNGLIATINNDNYDKFIGRYLVGSETPLTIETCKLLIGKRVLMRSPAYCRTEGTTICKRCIGDIVANSEVGMTALTSTVTSAFLSMYMALTHTSELSLHRYSFKDRIT